MSDTRSLDAFIDAFCPSALPYQRAWIEAALTGRHIMVMAGPRLLGKRWTTQQIQRLWPLWEGRKADYLIIDEIPLSPLSAPTSTPAP